MHVESNGKMSRLFVFDDFKYEFDKSEDPVCRESAFRCKNFHCIKSTVEKTVAVN